MANSNPNLPPLSPNTALWRLEKLRAAEIKARLEAANLSLSGTKLVLARRLHEYLQEQPVETANGTDDTSSVEEESGQEDGSGDNEQDASRGEAAEQSASSRQRAAAVLSRKEVRTLIQLLQRSSRRRHRSRTATPSRSPPSSSAGSTSSDTSSQSSSRSSTRTSRRGSKKRRSRSRSSGRHPSTSANRSRSGSGRHQLPTRSRSGDDRHRRRSRSGYRPHGHSTARGAAAATGPLPACGAAVDTGLPPVGSTTTGPSASGDWAHFHPYQRRSRVS